MMDLGNFRLIIVGDSSLPLLSVGVFREENLRKESKLSNIFSDLKIRGSYGMVGDDNVSGYAAFDYMSGL